MLDPKDQAEWRHNHIPHRLRAACARLDMRLSPLRICATINPPTPTEELGIYWRFATDSIWEGRFAATRWLIHFVGVPKKGNHLHDVHIDDLAGGVLVTTAHPEWNFLEEMWKGCSQASSHPTHDSRHPDVTEGPLSKALTIVVQHLQDTIYRYAGESVRDFVVRRAR